MKPISTPQHLNIHPSDQRSLQVRYFHWGLVSLTAASLASGWLQFGPHPAFGIMALVLLLWRWLWGVWGVVDDRWWSSPLKRHWLSRLAVQTLLLTTLLTCVSGLMAYEWWPTWQPKWLGEQQREWLGDPHLATLYLWLGVVATHIGAALYHRQQGHDYLSGIAPRTAPNHRAGPPTPTKKGIAWLLLIASTLFIALVLV